MPSFTLPEVDDVRDDSRLLPEQVDAAYSSDDLNADIAERIAAKATTILGKISRAAAPYVWPLSVDLIQLAYPAYTDDECAAESTQQQALATEATKLLTLASLYGSAGQLNRAYYTKASDYRRESSETLAELVEAISFVRAAQPTTAQGGEDLGMWTVNIQDRFRPLADEFGAC